MKRIKPYDIYVKPSPVLRKISVRRQGTWTFASIPVDKFARETKSARYYLISEPFGLVRYDRNNPKKTSFRGLAGDYISRDSDGNLSLVTAEQFRLKFPIPDETVRYAPLTSADYSKKPVEETASPSSNISTSNSTSTGAPTNARPTNTRPSY